MSKKRSGGTSCAISTCKNYYSKNKDIAYHVFPKEQNLRQEWIIKCKREDKFNVKTSRICSDHFTASDYQRDLRNELLGTFSH